MSRRCHSSEASADCWAASASSDDEYGVVLHLLDDH